MNDTQIQCFLTVAECRSVSRAAEVLYLAQPSVSRYIGQLEKQWEVELFSRRGNAMVLTPEGEEYYQLCRRTWKDFQDLKQRHQASREAARLTLRYSVFPVWNISRLLYENADQMSRRHPNWDLRLEICPADSLVRALLSGSVDLIFHVGTLLNQLEQVQVQPLLELPQIILFSARSEQAQKKRLTPADFRDRTFLFVPDEVLTETMVRRQMRSIEKRYGFCPPYRLLESTEALTVALELDQGVALMDYWSRYRTNPQLRFLGVDLPLPVVLAWRRDAQNPAIPVFAKETADWFSRQQVTG